MLLSRLVPAVPKPPPMKQYFKPYPLNCGHCDNIVFVYII